MVVYRQSSPLTDNSSLEFLNSSLYSQVGGSFNVSQPGETLEALYCALASAAIVDRCLGICPNPDITGIGVRLGNYFQCLMNVLLVVFSAKDSNLAAWSATMLTLAVVIPAMIQKQQGGLTIYHATQVLNFATISSLANLVVAPMCQIWRDREKGVAIEPEEDFDGDIGFDDEPDADELDETEVQERMTRLRQASAIKSRLTLSMALMAQVIFQWAWAIWMFASVTYSQTPCSPGTIVMLFGKRWTVDEINHNRHYYIFPLWLLFTMLVTISWGALLVLSSSHELHPIFSRSSTIVHSEEEHLLFNLPSRFAMRMKGFPYNEPKRLMVILNQALALAIITLLVYSTEYQARQNPILLGENQIWGFGQVAAILLAMVPVGVLVAAMYEKYQDRREEELQERQISIVVVPPPPSDDSSGTESEPRYSTGSQNSDFHASSSTSSSSFRTLYPPEDTPLLRVP